MLARARTYTHIYHHHHHHVVPLARISLTLSRYFSLSFIASGRISGLHPVSSHSCSMYVRAGRPVFARPYVVVHRSKSPMSSSLLLQQCPACLVCLTWIVFVMGGRRPYSWCFVGCCRQDLFNIALNTCVIAVYLLHQQILLAYGLPKETVAAITHTHTHTHTHIYIYIYIYIYI